MAALMFLTVFFLNIANIKTDTELNRGLLNVVENKLEKKLTEYAIVIGKWLENINDVHFNDSELGRLLGYKEMKRKFQVADNEGRGVKKMSMALLPVIFQVGATSTWLTLTGLLAAKSVLIGLVLLVFKIAVSSAKVASFFTAWKSKNHHHEYSWSPHYEHHGHHRSLRDDGYLTHAASHSDYASIHPNIYDLKEYKTLPSNYLTPDLEPILDLEEHKPHS